MSGETLWRALGFRSAAGIRQAAARKTLPIELFTISGRRGRFAWTSDVASWLSTYGERTISVSPQTNDGVPAMGRHNNSQDEVT